MLGEVFWLLFDVFFHLCQPPAKKIPWNCQLSRLTLFRSSFLLFFFFNNTLPLDCSVYICSTGSPSVALTGDLGALVESLFTTVSGSGVDDISSSLRREKGATRGMTKKVAASRSLTPNLLSIADVCFRLSTCRTAPDLVHAMTPIDMTRYSAVRITIAMPVLPFP